MECVDGGDGGSAACGRERIVDAFRDARLKLVAASGMGSLANESLGTCL